jgi:hypothetical protein
MLLAGGDYGFLLNFVGGEDGGGEEEADEQSKSGVFDHLTTQ